MIEIYIAMLVGAVLVGLIVGQVLALHIANPDNHRIQITFAITSLIIPVYGYYIGLIKGDTQLGTQLVFAWSFLAMTSVIASMRAHNYAERELVKASRMTIKQPPPKPDQSDIETRIDEILKKNR